jgi:hypothetical protein
MWGGGGGVRTWMNVDASEIAFAGCPPQSEKSQLAGGGRSPAVLPPHLGCLRLLEHPPMPQPSAHPHTLTHSLSLSLTHTHTYVTTGTSGDARIFLHKTRIFLHNTAHIMHQASPRTHTATALARLTHMKGAAARTQASPRSTKQMIRGDSTGQRKIVGRQAGGKADVQHK